MKILCFRALKKLVSLTDLNLSGNNIQVLPQTVVSAMENLEVLCLHSNLLRAIPDLRRLNSLKAKFEEECERINRICFVFRYWI